MTKRNAVEQAAQALATKNEDQLVVLLGLRQMAIEKDPKLNDDLTLNPRYQSATMSMEEVKAVALRIVNRWNKELQVLTCGTNPDQEKDRKAILDALNVGDAAVIAAVAGALLAMSVPATIAAALSPLIYKRFIATAKDELCKEWAKHV